MKHERHRMHFNSMEALHIAGAKLTGRRAMVWKALRLNRPMTDREVMQHLGFSDMNTVRPRVTELIERGLLEERGVKTCDVTGMKVRVVGVPNALPPAQDDAFDDQPVANFMRRSDV